MKEKESTIIGFAEYLQAREEGRMLDQDATLLLIPLSVWQQYEQMWKNHQERIDQIFAKVQADLANLIKPSEKGEA
jgi:hypothetical protein